MFLSSMDTYYLINKLSVNYQYVPATSQICHRPVHLEDMFLMCVFRFSLKPWNLFSRLVAKRSICMKPMGLRDNWWVGPIPRFPIWAGVVHLQSCSFRLGPSKMGRGRLKKLRSEDRIRWLGPLILFDKKPKKHSRIKSSFWILPVEQIEPRHAHLSGGCLDRSRRVTEKIKFKAN